MNSDHLHGAMADEEDLVAHVALLRREVARREERELAAKLGQ